MELCCFIFQGGGFKKFLGEVHDCSDKLPVANVSRIAIYGFYSHMNKPSCLLSFSMHPKICADNFYKCHEWNKV
jgi:hypothetical protein